MKSLMLRKKNGGYLFPSSGQGFCQWSPTAAISLVCKIWTNQAPWLHEPSCSFLIHLPVCECVCVCLCVYVCMCVCILVCVYVCVYMHVNGGVSMCVHIWCKYMWVCVSVSVHECSPICCTRVGFKSEHQYRPQLVSTLSFSEAGSLQTFSSLLH